MVLFTLRKIIKEYFLKILSENIIYFKAIYVFPSGLALSTYGIRIQREISWQKNNPKHFKDFL